MRWVNTGQPSNWKLLTKVLQTALCGKRKTPCEQWWGQGFPRALRSAALAPRHAGTPAREPARSWRTLARWHRLGTARSVLCRLSAGYGHANQTISSKLVKHRLLVLERGLCARRPSINVLKRSSIPIKQFATAYAAPVPRPSIPPFVSSQLVLSCSQRSCSFLHACTTAAMHGRTSCVAAR